MKVLDNVIQGDASWHAARAKHFCASDASAMMGASKYKARNELLREKSQGFAEEVSPQKQRLFDAGHEAEANARPHAEAIIGESLFPVTAVAEIDGLPLLASLDGITADDSTLWEHKLYGEELASSVAGNDLDEHYIWQMEHQLLVTGAERVLFMASDGTSERLVHCWYYPDTSRREKLIAGWKQFAADLANYVPPEVIPAAVAAPQEALPALFLKVDGAIAVDNNLPVVSDALHAYLARLNRKPETDQDFADLDASAKLLRDLQSRVKAAKENAFAQITSFDEMKRAADLIEETARKAAIEIENIVKAEKEKRRMEIVSDGKQRLMTHIAGLNAEIGKPYMPTIDENFIGAVKGLKSLDSIKNAIDTELARCKIEADGIAKRIRENLKTLREKADGYQTLFPDTAQLVHKESSDLEAIITARIAEHKAAEEKRKEAEAEKKRQEEERNSYVAPANAAGAANETVPPLATSTGARAVESKPVAAAVPDNGKTIKLGEINSRLGFTVTAEFLGTLGFHATTEKNAKLYRECDFQGICDALICHVQQVAGKQLLAA